MRNPSFATKESFKLLGAWVSRFFPQIFTFINNNLAEPNLLLTGAPEAVANTSPNLRWRRDSNRWAAPPPRAVACQSACRFLQRGAGGLNPSKRLLVAAKWTSKDSTAFWAPLRSVCDLHIVSIFLGEPSHA